MPDWYEDDDFWRCFAPLLLDETFAGDVSRQLEDTIRLLGLNAPARILDLCCGPGRHAIELARRGFDVVGVDRTSEYLETARRKAAEANLDIELVREDMRSFSRPETFDAAFNFFSSFGYFDDPSDDSRVIDNLYCSLKPGGRLLMELMGKEVLARSFRPTDWGRMDDGTLVMEERKLLEGWKWVQSRRIFIRGSERKEFTIKLRLYVGTELAGLLRQAGFRSVELYGGLDGSPYDHTAKRLVVTAAK